MVLPRYHVGVSASGNYDGTLSNLESCSPRILLDITVLDIEVVCCSSSFTSMDSALTNASTILRLRSLQMLTKMMKLAWAILYIAYE